MYLIELRLVLSQALEGSMPLDQAQTEAARLIKEYGERVAYWTEHPPYGLEAQLMGAQHGGNRLHRQTHQEVLKALAAGDAVGAKGPERRAQRVFAAPCRSEQHGQGIAGVCH